MPREEGSDSAFDPWYEYLSTLELAVVAGTGATLLAVLASGVTDPSVALGPAVGLALLLAGFLAFLTRWAVSEERAAAVPALDEE